MVTINGKKIFFSYTTRPVTLITYPEKEGEQYRQTAIKERHILTGKPPDDFVFFVFDLKVLIGLDAQRRPMFHMEHNIPIANARTHEEVAYLIGSIIEDTNERVQKELEAAKKEAAKPRIEIHRPGDPLPFKQ